MNDVITEIIKRPHPAIVHFPISLYPVSALFALLYSAQGEVGFLMTSYWSFLIASAILLPVALTGFLDMVRLKTARSEKAHRLLMLHLFNGIAVTLFGLTAGFYFWRNSPLTDSSAMNAFTTCAILLALMVLGQGIIAALMIYQHKLGVDGETR